MRSWSLLKEPPGRSGVYRLAIERESLAPEQIGQRTIIEDAFGAGRSYIWDEGEVEIAAASSTQLILIFKGSKLSGKFELRRMAWYPGNRWLFNRYEPGGRI